jgi:Flp pilus assembly protein TadD
MNRGRAAEAAPAFQRAIVLHPTDIAAAENLGRSLFLSGQYAPAVRTLRAVVALPQHSAEPLLDLAGALARTGAADEAEEICRAARTQFPRDSRFDLMLANLLLVRGAPAEAAQVLEAAATAGGRRDAFLLDRLAVTLAAAGRFSDAERVLEEALALHPGPRPEAVLQGHLGKIRSGEVPR